MHVSNCIKPTMGQPSRTPYCDDSHDPSEVGDLGISLLETNPIPWLFFSYRA